ncbi:phosphotransferase family protein [Luteimicrobium subarcticum]|uniref:Aminoglycoside phosphotransferase (APT) family kinase protein n=1 Tax=Luteimicrobium subarcticum TaxID=620910 RepID=A0A2M8W1L5_9MICO|nr:phosphotransferase [Luteimicrobium subarcticum]PJI84821.1 aminoglycoside phosphotransferase (APT) family kinase protein [Luteimicrobium subarcticum]
MDEVASTARETVPPAPPVPPVPVASGGARLLWDDLPAAVRVRVESRLGSPVVGASSASTGFSPGLASVLTGADGRRTFVKAAREADQPDAARLNRQEASLVVRLPDHLPVPRLLWCDDTDGWVVLGFEAVDGMPPSTPWDAVTLASSVTALDAVGDLLAPAGLVPVAESVRSMFEGWQRLRAEPDPALADLVPWAAQRLERLAALAQDGTDAATGDRLLHLDARADNLLVAADATTWVVDWAHGAVGAPWVEVAAFLPSVGMQGVVGRSAPLVHGRDAAARRVTGELLAATFEASRHGGAADPDAVRAFVAGLAGFFVDSSRRPAVPGIPNLRPFQRAQGVAALAWLEALER